MLGGMRRSLVAALAASTAFVAVAVGMSGCEESAVTRQVESLQKQIQADQELLAVEAETSDPARKNLEADFVESSVMSIRPTSNPERPYVGYVRIRWRFRQTDGKPVGDVVWDYIYAQTPDQRWIKADEAEAELPPRQKPGGTRDTGPFPDARTHARRPA